MPVIAYADDVFKGLNCVNPQQIRSILQVFEDFSKVSGLKISLDKTAIFALNMDPNLLREIPEMTGIKVVTEIKNTWESNYAVHMSNLELHLLPL
jgi:hypothetical protein